MDKYNLITSFFSDQKDYIDFLVTKSLRIIANDEGTCFAQLKAEGGYYSYILAWKDEKHIGDYVIPFRASQENIDKFNIGCKILADRLKIYIETNDVTKVPSEPPAFGDLTQIV